MKFICDTQKFSEICSNVQRSVSTKSTIPAIEGILITTTDNSVTVTGYDLEVGVITSAPAKVEEQGSIILNAKILCDILRNLPSQTVSIEVDKKLSAKIKSGDAEFSLLGINPQEYPELPTVNSTFPISVKGELLKDMIRKTIFATSENDIKIVHTGVRFEISNKLIRLVAVDGYRLAIRNEELDYEGDEQIFVVPKKALNEIIKLVSDDEAPVAMNIGKRHIVFEVNNYIIVSRLLDGEFLNYKAAIPTNEKTKVIANSRMLINSIERTALVITDRTRSPIRCIFDEDMIKTSAMTTLGAANDRIPAEVSGERIEIGFNNRFILDALKVCDTDEVLIKLVSPVHPITIEPKEGNSFLFLVLPVKL
ncbi:MAG: DNA polymerase III subunit beta [Ruminococcaceae bacterium]|nr:DNA polymerase III subunit beta [Oscillospiraceae bacterium]